MRGGRVGVDAVRQRQEQPVDETAATAQVMRKLRAELAFARAQLATLLEVTHEALDGWESLAPLVNDEHELARIAEIRASLPPASPREVVDAEPSEPS